METKTLILIGLIAGILIIAGIYIGVGKTTISAQGNSVIEVEPDIVGVYFNVQIIDDSAEDAKNQVATIVAELRDNLLYVVDEDEISTTSFNIRPNYNWRNGNREIDGYTATQNIEVKTERISKTGRIVDIGVNAGALVNWINFELSEEHESEVKAQALAKAAEDAKMKAEAIAKGLGKRLGGLVQVTTNDFNYYPYRLYEKGLTAGSVEEAIVDISPKDLEVRAYVGAVYQIW